MGSLVPGHAVAHLGDVDRRREGDQLVLGSELLHGAARNGEDAVGHGGDDGRHGEIGQLRRNPAAAPDMPERQVGAPVKLVYNQRTYSMDGWTIPKGTPMADIARQFIRFSLDAIIVQPLPPSSSAKTSRARRKASTPAGMPQ